MKIVSRRLGGLTFVWVFLLLACAPGGVGDDGGRGAAEGELSQEGGSFSVGTLEPVGIEPVTMADLYGFQVARLLFDGLTDLSADLEVVPAAAAEWEASDDNTVFTFQLREGIRFSNGREVTAGDFVYSWNRVANPESAANVAYHGLPILGWGDVMEGHSDQIEGLRAIDDQTLEVTTAEPFVLLPMVLAHPVFSPVPEEIFGDDPAAFSDEPVGNGPYMMDGPWRHNEGISLVRNPEYAGEAGNADGIEFRSYNELSTMFRDVQAGNLDIGYEAPPVEEVQAAREEFGDRLIQVSSGLLNYLGFPTTSPPYDAPDIRRALSMAIDRDAIVDSIYHGTGIPARGLVPPVAPGAVEDACASCTFDPEEAQRLLEEAGGIPGETVKLYYAIGDQALTDTMEAIANGWSTHLGLETEFEVHEFSPFVDLLYEGIDDGIHSIGWIWDYPSAYSFLSPLLESTSGDNLTAWSNEDFDRALREARVAETIEAGLPALEEAQRIAGEEVPIAPFHFPELSVVHTDRVSEVVLDGLGTLRAEEVAVTGS